MTRFTPDRSPILHTDECGWWQRNARRTVGFFATAAVLAGGTQVEATNDGRDETSIVYESDLSSEIALLQNSIDIIDKNEWGGRTIEPTAVVLHWWGNVGNGTIDPLINTLRNRNLSVQFGITLSGETYRLTEQDNTYASHAGDANPYSIGIEIEGPPFTDAQIEAAAQLSLYLMNKYNIPLEERWDGRQMYGLTDHDEVDPYLGARPSRKDDVGQYYEPIRNRVQELASGAPPQSPAAPAPPVAPLTPLAGDGSILALPPEELAKYAGSSAGSEVQVITAPPKTGSILNQGFTQYMQTTPAVEAPSAAVVRPPQIFALPSREPVRSIFTPSQELPPVTTETPAAVPAVPETAAPASEAATATVGAGTILAFSPSTSEVFERAPAPLPEAPAAPVPDNLPPEPAPVETQPTGPFPEQTLATFEKSRARFEELRPVYEAVAARNGIPWQMLAAVHWREGGSSLRTDVSTLAGERLGTVNPDQGFIVNTFDEGLQYSVDYLKGLAKDKYGVAINTDGNSIEDLQKAFLAYNRGRLYVIAGIPPDRSPYVMNGFNDAYMNMSWTQGDPVNGVDGNTVGALPIYLLLGGPVR